jgi:hypothetical protein
MDEAFSYMKDGEFYSIHKHTFPRFKATFDYKKPLPELVQIKFLDECKVKDKAHALWELDAYMKSIRKELRKQLSSKSPT